jgi:uncharacterized protein
MPFNMLELGKINALIAKRRTDNGVYLEDTEGNEVLLPNAYAADVSIDDTVECFIYTDSEDRPVASTLMPKLFLGEVALLTVKSVTFMGAFLDWGLPKDLFVPFIEQQYKMEEGKTYAVCLLEDKVTQRLFGSSRIKKHLRNNDAVDYSPGDKVSLYVLDFSDLGINVLIDSKHFGLVYDNDVFVSLNHGDVLDGYIRRIREDGKIDVTLRKFGYDKVEDSTDVIITKLQEHGGELPLSDKSSPEEIETLLNMSKKTFKKAIGGLYKEKRISIEPNKIVLIRAK